MSALADCATVASMKAVVYHRYGPPDVLSMTDVDTPVPRDNEVLVKVHAFSLNGSDWETLVRNLPAKEKDALKLRVLDGEDATCAQSCFAASADRPRPTRRSGSAALHNRNSVDV